MAEMGLVERFVNRCRRDSSKGIGSYEEQRELLTEVIDKLHDTDLSEKAFDNSIVKKLKAIGNDVILDKISMADMPFIVYLFHLKYKGNIKTTPTSDDCIIKAGGQGIANMSYLATYIHFMEIRNDSLHIEGNVSWPSVFRERCTFGVKNNEEKFTCELYDRGMDLKKGPNIYEIRKVFSVNIPLKDRHNSIVFCNYLDGKECVSGKINAMRFSPVADVIKNQYCHRGDWIIYIEGNVLHCEKADEKKLKHHEELFQKELQEGYVSKAEWAISLRNEYFFRLKEKKKPIWLFMDRIDRAGDNAEVLYRYAKKSKEIDSYFIIRDNTNDFRTLKELGNVIPLNSREHLILVLMADYIISSQANGVVENPFWDNAEYFRDLYHQAKIVFLQHGVIKDDMSTTLDRYNTNFYGFITSSARERQSIIDYPYYYTEDKVWLTGLPRFDVLYNDPKKYIVIMPSWRQGLMQQEWDEAKSAMVWKVKEGFLHSEYVHKYRALISNRQLQKACEEYGYQLVFMPHALMAPYISSFMEDDKCLYWGKNKHYRDVLAQGSLMVTDYSSIAFDFAYLGKPVIYYQFDKEKFFLEHTYKEGYYDYEDDGFGEVVYTEEELVEIIMEYIKNDCEVKDKYKNRVEQTFAYHDKNNCRRIYEHLIKGVIE